MKMRFVLLAALALLPVLGNAAPCESEDFENRVSGASTCLLIKRFGVTETGAAQAMLIWLHGDVSSGGPATYHFALAEKAVTDLKPTAILSIALVRPGYPSEGNAASTGDLNARRDHYTRENVTEIATAVEKLKEKYKPRKVILIGHSGGAAIAAILLGLKPDLAQTVVLAACPCDISTWRAGRRPWGRSEDPLGWADKVDSKDTVLAFTGSKDDNTSPELAKRYVQTLTARGVKAEFQLVPDATHNSVVRSQMVSDAIAGLVNDR